MSGMLYGAGTVPRKENIGAIFRYSGSKRKIADKIILLFPDDYKKLTYLEPFFGTGAVFFKKEPSVIETINDINGDIYNLFLQIRENGDKLSQLVENTPWSRQEFVISKIKTEDNLENARRFLTRQWFSYGGKNTNSSGWTQIIKDESSTLVRYSKVPELIKIISNRLKIKSGNVVQIENLDALILIKKYDRENVLMYLDPPYILNTRKNRKYYNCEVTTEFHIKLCEIIKSSKAKIILSGYENDIYDKQLKNFYKKSVNTYDTKGNKKQEILWMNYSTTKDLFDDEDESGS